MTRTGLGAGRAGLVHQALLYEDDDSLVSVVVPFVRDGVRAGEPVLVSLTGRALDLVLAALGDDCGVTVVEPPARRADPFEALDDHRRRWAALVRDGAPQIRAVGDVPSDPCDWHRWVRYEAAVTHAVADLPVWALCAYDRRTLDPVITTDVASTHTHLAGRLGHAPNPGYRPPETFLTARAEREVDPLEGTPPAHALRDPSPRVARDVVRAAAAGTSLDREAIAGLALAVTEVVANAHQHGEPPVELRVWAAADRVVVAVHDHGHGPADPFVGVLLDDGGGIGLRVAYRACHTVTLRRGAEGFTAHLVARPRRPARTA